MSTFNDLCSSTTPTLWKHRHINLALTCLHHLVSFLTRLLLSRRHISQSKKFHNIWRISIYFKTRYMVRFPNRCSYTKIQARIVRVFERGSKRRVVYLFSLFSTLLMKSGYFLLQFVVLFLQCLLIVKLFACKLLLLFKQRQLPIEKPY